MPRGTADLEGTQRYDLKTAPPDGYVVLRRMSYGQILQRRALVSNMKVTSSRKSKDFEGEINMMQESVTLLEFQNCIVDHNLTSDDAGEHPLDLRSQIAIRSLDPRIGQEIEKLISDMNNFDEEDEEGN
jgi:hypothetical protein